MNTPRPDDSRSRFRLPGVGTSLVVALLIIGGSLLIGYRASRTGIRRVEAVGGMVDCRPNWLSAFVTDYLDVDPARLSTDADVGGVLLNGPQITDDVLSVLPRFGTVESVTLFDTSVTNEGLEHLTASTRITNLGIYASPQISDAGLPQLAGLSRLKWLYLEKTELTDEGLNTIIEQFPDLESLVLNEVRGITDEGVLNLSALTSLKNVSLQNTNISDKAVEKLIHALPGCTILHESTLAAPAGTAENSE